jgi:hypothetical protein
MCNCRSRTHQRSPGSGDTESRRDAWNVAIAITDEERASGTKAIVGGLAFLGPERGTLKGERVRGGVSGRGSLLGRLGQDWVTAGLTGHIGAIGYLHHLFTYASRTRMPKITITIDVPDGALVQVAQSSSPAGLLAANHSATKKYWQEYLSSNGRKIYRAAANIETLPTHGPGYTLEDIAEALSITYESAKSMHRTSGRSARKWREDTGMPEPIRLEEIEYLEVEENHAQRTTYRLPLGIADEIYGQLALDPPN